MNGFLIIKIFPTKILHIENFSIAYFTDIIYYLEFVRVCHIMLGHGIWSTSVRLPLRRTHLKTRIHLKERSYPIVWAIIEGLSSIASCNAKALNPSSIKPRYWNNYAKWPVTKNSYMKLTPAQIILHQ